MAPRRRRRAVQPATSGTVAAAGTTTTAHHRHWRLGCHRRHRQPPRYMAAVDARGRRGNRQGAANRPDGSQAEPTGHSPPERLRMCRTRVTLGGGDHSMGIQRVGGGGQAGKDPG
ncbi:hypothetical protein I4F81_001639 [Pyropia yezoensis]|uniref:Uncharacterized protein n=1 Tax=Pyropia yezoensis TaxID=2788 RepID=A0ACC3BNH4_PYRYE|nr:hypothetical protein I4F81_001639 [Neopyropia yezoensis]